MQSVLTTFDDVLVALRTSKRMTGNDRLRALTGGVSALVALVEGDGQPWIVKTPLGQLTVSDEWLVDRQRGANEATILELLDGQLGPVRTPRLLFFDEDLVLMGEEFIAPPAVNYKEDLLAGRAHLEVAVALGKAVGELHRLSAPPMLVGSGPRELFDALRLDPYYRMAAQRRPDLREGLLDLVHDTIAQPLRSLVHGDLSPKNILVTSSAPVLLDWEVVHTGDPGFDMGMMGAHLLLKAIYLEVRDAGHDLVEALRQFWTSYDGPADVEQSIRHTGGVMLARLYGKSPVEYLNNDVARDRAHRIGARALSGRITTVASLLSLIEDE